MASKVRPMGPIPQGTRILAEQLFTPTHPLRLIGDRLGEFVSETDFANLYSHDGTPAVSPALLAMVTVLQVREWLSDRQAAAMVVCRVDWKYALHLPLDYAGFDFCELHEFRHRLLSNQIEARVFDQLLTSLHHAGLLSAHRLLRTASIASIEAVHELSRVELVRETLRLSCVSSSSRTTNAGIAVCRSSGPSALHSISEKSGWSRPEAENRPANAGVPGVVSRTCGRGIVPYTNCNAGARG